MSRYDFPVLSLRTLFKIINSNKIGFRITKSATILKKNPKMQFIGEKNTLGRAR